MKPIDFYGGTLRIPELASKLLDIDVPKFEEPVNYLDVNYFSLHHPVTKGIDLFGRRLLALRVRLLMTHAWTPDYLLIIERQPGHVAAMGLHTEAITDSAGHIDHDKLKRLLNGSTVGLGVDSDTGHDLMMTLEEEVI